MRKHGLIYWTLENLQMTFYMKVRKQRRNKLRMCMDSKKRVHLELKASHSEQNSEK